MVDGVISGIGQCALLLAEEEPKQEPEPALTLLLLTVVLGVRERMKRSRIVTIAAV